MHIREFKVCSSVGSSYAQRIPKELWEHHRTVLTELHDRGLTRLEIIRTVQKEYGFRPSPGQLNAKFKEWGLKVYGSTDVPETGDCGFRRRALSDQTTHGSTSDSTVIAEQTPHPSGSSSQQEGHGAENEGVAVDFNIHNRINDISHTEPIVGNDQTLMSNLAHLEQPSDVTFDEFDESFVNDLFGTTVEFFHSPITLTQPESTDSSKIVLREGPQLDSDPSIQFQLPIPVNDTSIHDLPMLNESSSKEDSYAKILVDSWYNKVYPCDRNSDLQATLDLTGFLYSSRLYSYAFMLYKRLYSELSVCLQPDDLLRLGALVNCARLVDESDALEVMFVTEAITFSISWCEDHWSQPASHTGLEVQRYLQSLLAGLNKAPSSYRQQQSTEETSEHNLQDLSVLYDALGVVSSGCEHMFAHVAVLASEIDPVICPCLFETMSGLVQWSFRCLNLANLDIDAHFLSSRASNAEDKWHTIRRISLHLASSAGPNKLSDFTGKSTWPCKCSFCPTMKSLVRSCLSETCMALSCVIYDQIDSFLWNSMHGEVSVLPFDGKSSFVQYAVRNIRATSFRSKTPEDTYKHLSILRDFSSAYRSCFEPVIVVKNEQQVNVASSLVNEAQEIFIRCHGLQNGFSDQESSSRASVRKPSVPAQQWLKKLAANTNILNTPNIDSSSRLKRNRSAVSSMLASQNSRSSSLRSFEHFAKRLRQRSNISTRSGRSQTSPASRTSSHLSWQFDTVTGLRSLSETIQSTEDHQIIEEDGDPEEAPPPYEESNWPIQINRELNDESNTSPPAYRLRSVTLPNLPPVAQQTPDSFRTRHSYCESIHRNHEVLEVISAVQTEQQLTTKATSTTISHPESNNSIGLELENMSDLTLHDDPVLQVAHF